MIPLSRPPRPTGFVQAVANARAEVERAIASGTAVDWRTLAATWRRFKSCFVQAQDGKCAYCEFMVAGGAYGDVEHFRPKAAVDEMGVVTTRGEPRDRQLTRTWDQGYWWLAFDWNNLLLCCQICNETWKGAVFPARTPSGGRHRVVPGRSRRERVLLLNPFDVADVSPHITFTPLGQVQGLTDEGRNTIAACGLFRPALLTQRATLRTQVVNLLSIASRGDAQSVQEVLDNLELIGGNAAPYAGAVRSFYETETHTAWPPQSSVIGP